MESTQREKYLSDTPRTLGLLNHLALVVRGPGNLAWIFCCLLLQLALYMGLKSFWIESTSFSNPGVVAGVCDRVSDTNLTVNEEEQYEVGFYFEHEGKRYTGFSYVLGYPPKEGSRVEVEYVLKDPNISRIRGLHYARFPILIGVLTAFILLLALIGVMRSLRGFRLGHLLVYGNPVQATLVSKEPTNVSINDETVYKLNFEYTDPAGEVRSLVVKSHKYDHLVDEKYELALCDPGKPELCFLFDDLPLSLTISQSGQWDPPKGTMGLFIRSAVFFGLMGWTFFQLFS